jgi:hypothetical protein
VYLWRYLENVRNYPGWNVAVDRARTEALRAALARLAEGPVPSNDLSCAQPGENVLSIPNNAESPIASARLLRLEATSDSAVPTIRECEGIVTFSMSPGVAKRLASSLDDPSGIFDTALLDEPVVWYWGVVPDIGQCHGNNVPRNI